MKDEDVVDLIGKAMIAYGKDCRDAGREQERNIIIAQIEEMDLTLYSDHDEDLKSKIIDAIRWRHETEER